MRKVFSLMRAAARTERRLLSIYRRYFSYGSNGNFDRNKPVADQSTKHQKTKQGQTEHKEHEEYYESSLEHFFKKKMEADKAFMEELKRRSYKAVVLFSVIFFFSQIQNFFESRRKSAKPEAKSPFESEESKSVVKEVSIGSIVVPITIPQKKGVKFEDVIVG